MLIIGFLLGQGKKVTAFLAICLHTIYSPCSRGKSYSWKKHVSSVVATAIVKPRLQFHVLCRVLFPNMSILLLDVQSVLQICILCDRIQFCKKWTSTERKWNCSRAWPWSCWISIHFGVAYEKSCLAMELLI